MAHSFNVQEAREELQKLDSGISGEKYSPVPRGIYKVIIKSSEIKENKKGTGKHLSISFEIISNQYAISPKYTGRLLWTTFNILHNDEKVRNIAKSELIMLCEAIGIEKYNHEGELVNRMLMVETIVERYEDPITHADREKNVIKKYKNINDYNTKKEEDGLKEDNSFKDDDLPF